VLQVIICPGAGGRGGEEGSRILVEWLSVPVTQRGPIASVEAFATYETVTLLRLIRECRPRSSFELHPTIALRLRKITKYVARNTEYHSGDMNSEAMTVAFLYREPESNWKAQVNNRRGRKDF